LPSGENAGAAEWLATPGICPVAKSFTSANTYWYPWDVNGIRVSHLQKLQEVVLGK